MFFAGIVLFNPDIERLKSNIESIANQVDRIICIDNNSKNLIEINILLNKYDNVVLYNNNTNMGIAYALNQIVKWGKKNRYKWGIMLDQDSIVQESMISHYSKYIFLRNIAIISPIINDINQTRNKSINLKKEFEYINNENEVITSGSLINIEICNIVGGFNEKLFIDYVDIEYNKRILINGYKIIRMNSTVLYHEIGNIKEYNILGMKICCSNHSAFRRYYMVRNRLFYNEKYGDKLHLYRSILRLFFGTIKIIIFEDDKSNKVKSTIRGYMDYKSLL